MLKKIEGSFEHLLFSSRWLMAPVYLGLVLGMLILLIKFAKQLWIMFSNVLTDSAADVIVGILSLVDVALIMNLMIIIIFSGYENFVSKMDDLHDHEDRPDWMGHIGFADLKIKLIGSIAAISGIELLKEFMKISNLDDVGNHSIQLGWMVGIHLTFILSGVLYALTDYISHKK